MKKFILTMFIALGAMTAQAQAKEIKWMSIDEALAAQKKAAKPIFMDVYTDWCGPCKMLDKNTFHDPAVVEYITKNYYPVKFNAEGNSEVNYKGKKYANPGFVADKKGRNAMHQFAASLNLEGYPSMVVLNKKGDVANTIVGYLTPAELLAALK